MSYQFTRFGVGAFAFAAVVALAQTRPVAADEFLLSTGARIDGEFLNADQSPRTTYELKLASGSKLIFTRDQVQEVVRVSPAELEYETLRHQEPDTAEGHWKLATWCKENKLAELSKEHLRRVIELEPNHKDARPALGYSRIQGQWRTQAEHLASLGKVQHKGQWRYPQEIMIIEAKEKADQAKQTWFRNLKALHDKIGGNAGPAAMDSIANISDPWAIPALKASYDKERSNQSDTLRELYVRAFGKIDNYAADAVLCEIALHDDSSEIRQTALEILAAAKRKNCVDYFIRGLTHADNVIVNRAGVALSYFKDPRSIAPLIDALVTTHTTTLVAGNAGQIGAGFGGQVGGGMGGGLNMGQSVINQKNQKQNRGVYEGLLSVIDNKANYQFDEEAWKHWYSALKKAKAIDVRRS